MHVETEEGEAELLKAIWVYSGLAVSPEVHRDKREDRAVSDGKGTITV